MAQKIVFTMEFPRGDSYQRGFQLEVNETIDTGDFDDIYFTVKKSFENFDYIFQKRLTTGGIVNDDMGHYIVNIRPEDTNDMDFGDYDCDIEFFRDTGGFKKTFCGRFKLTREVTHYYNEQ